MKYLIVLVGLTLALPHTIIDRQTELNSFKEMQEDWEVLFDGTSFDAWKGYGTDKVPEYWKIEDGAMVFYPPAEDEKRGQQNIVSRKEYHSFVLSLEWKISPGGNSGIFWGVKEDEKYNQPYETGPEIQVLDNSQHPDAKRGTSHQAGALYDMVSPAKDMTNAIGEWNHCVLTVNYKTNEAKVALNGETIVSFTPKGKAWDEMVAKSKFADWQGFGKFNIGKIGLQDHSDKVAYRNIKIKEL